MIHRVLVAGFTALLVSAAPSWAQAQPLVAPTAPYTTSLAAESSQGAISYYGRKFAGRKTASGERFNPASMTMAHRSLPFGSMVRVTNLKNNKSVVVRVNDRGPSTPGRVGDVSLAAANKLHMLRSGVVEARIEPVGRSKKRRQA
jgi:rare lipoprotein A